MVPSTTIGVASMLLKKPVWMMALTASRFTLLRSICVSGEKR